MLIDDARTRELLARIVYRLCSDSAVRDDLIQEALVHLWLLEERRPGQRQSWYLQSCKFHLQNYLAAGRSVDSPKRRAGKTAYDEDELEALSTGGFDGQDAVLAQVSARDIFTLLSGRLTPFEQTILNLLAEGLSAREIAGRMNVTHPTVIKYRRKIAALAIRLGIPPLPKYARHLPLALAR
jgi:RNA polymerase sigma factor (sigma-70 family)